LPVVAAALSGLASISFALMLLGVAGAAYSFWSLLRLRRDHLVVEAAERLATVNLSHVVRRYVPRRLRSHRRSEELLLARQIIDARRPGWKRWAIVSAVLVVCSASATTFFIHRNLRATTVIRADAQALPSGDALVAIQGVWGWRADFLQSCTENPQAISVSPDRRKLSVHYAKPISSALPPQQDFDFDIVSTQPDMLVLSGPVSATRPNLHSASVSIKFLDADTYIATNSDRPSQTTGTIERCK
jgi:hypothetical protein